MSMYGPTGATAYMGMTDIGRPQAGETVVVSAAAGATGSVAGQIAKIAGARVVGIAGGPEKCKAVVEDFGFDACIDYKNEDVRAALKRHCPKGVDVYFDNVGGPILDAVLGRLAMKARVVLCGVISSYLTGEHPGPANYVNLLSKSASMQGFNALDMWERFEDAYADLRRWEAEGPAGAPRDRAGWPGELRRGAQRSVHRGQHRQDAGEGQLTLRRVRRHAHPHSHNVYLSSESTPQIDLAGDRPVRARDRWATDRPSCRGGVRPDDLGVHHPSRQPR